MRWRETRESIEEKMKSDSIKLLMSASVNCVLWTEGKFYSENKLKMWKSVLKLTLTINAFPVLFWS